MNEKEAFIILEIDETKEEEAIKQAYRAKLVHVNPEDDPEGFKQLRQAYETAVAYARQDEGVDGLTEDTSPVGLWMKEAEEIYRSIHRRIDVECWRQLFNEDVFVDLDTSGACKVRFIRFMMDNFRLPTEVWNYLDKTLSLRESGEELYEQFPKDFVDYVMHQCENGDWFPYERLEGEETAEYDLFINRFFEISRKMEAEDDGGVEQMFDQVDSLGIRHPYMELERARFWQMSGKAYEANRLADKIVEEMGSEDGRVCYIVAGIKWANEKKDEAAGFYQTLLKETPEHYLANKMMGRYYKEKAEYEKAKEHCIEAIKVSHDPELDGMLRDINTCIMDGFREKLQADPDDMRARLELGWCYLQNEEYTKGIALVTAKEPDEATESEYHNLLGKLYYAKELPEKAEEHVKLWIQCLEKENPEDEKEKADRIRRFGTGHAILAQIYRKRGEKDKSWYSKALQEIDEAIRYTGGELGYRMEKGYICNDNEQYDTTVELCTAILRENPSYFPAIVLRQETYSKLRNAQAVIADYHEAVSIFAGFPRVYELAAEVYYDFRRYDDLEIIFKAAEENKVESNLLDLYKGRVMRAKAESMDDGRQVLAYLQGLETTYKERGATDKDMGELLCEIGLCFDNLRETDHALASMNRAIKATEDNVRYYWILANFLEEKKDYKGELDILLKFKDHWDDGDSYHYHLGESYYHLGKMDEALEHYKKTLEYNTDHERANSRIVDIYTSMLEDKEDLQYLDLAVPYADRQLEINEHAYYYIERGLLYMAGCVWDKALADFGKAAELEPDNLYAHNNAGCVYKYTADYEHAIEEFAKAIKIMEDAGGSEDTPLPYGNMGDTYERMGDFENAYVYYKKNIERYPKNSSNYRSLAELCRRMKKFSEAISLYEKAEGEGGRFQEKKGDVLFEEGKAKEALECYKAAFKAQAITESDYNEKCGEVYLYLKKNYFLAEIALKKALKTAEGQKSEYRDAAIELAKLYHLKGNREKAAYYAGLGLKGYETAFHGLDKFLEGLYYQPAGYYRIGILYYLAGDMENAAKHFHAMEQVRRCKKCTNTNCVERLIGAALLSEAEGDKEKARTFYEAALREDPNRLFAAIKLERLV